MFPYRPNLSIFPDCSNTSQTHATCSWVKPSCAMMTRVEAALVEIPFVKTAYLKTALKFMKKIPYRPNLSIFPDCSNTSQTHATCSWVKPSGAMMALLEAAATEAMAEVVTAVVWAAACWA